MRKWTLFLMAIILTGCSSGQPRSTPVQAPAAQEQPAGNSTAATPATPGTTATQPASPGRADYDAALALIAKGDMAGALTALNRAVKADPNLAEAWNDLSYVEVHQVYSYISRPKTYPAGKDESPAVQAARKALGLKPDWPFAQFNLGIALLMDGFYADATEPLRRSSEQQPDRPEPLTAYGIALLDTGKLDAAVAACSKAKTLKPDFAPAGACLRQARVGMKRLPHTEAALGGHTYVPAKHNFTSTEKGEWMRINPPDVCGSTYPDGFLEVYAGCRQDAPGVQWGSQDPKSGTTPAGVGVGKPWSTVTKAYGDDTIQSATSRSYAVADLILDIDGSEAKGVTSVTFFKPSAYDAFIVWMKPRP